MLRAACWRSPQLGPSWEGFDFVSPSWLELRSVLRAAAAVLALVSSGATARAQGKLDARYTASLAGIPVGKGAWVLDIAEDQYTAAASGTTTGLLRVFASGQGTSAARGLTSNGQTVSGTYASTVAAESGSHSHHRCAQARRDRSDDRIADPCRRKRRSAQRGSLSAQRVGL